MAVRIYADTHEHKCLSSMNMNIGKHMNVNRHLLPKTNAHKQKHLNVNRKDHTSDLAEFSGRSRGAPASRTSEPGVRPPLTKASLLRRSLSPPYPNRNWKRFLSCDGSY